MSVFTTLNTINVNEHTEKKNGLTYLSWAWAWQKVKENYCDATYKIYERDTEHGPVNYFTDGNTCWVKTSVTIADVEHMDMLPIMDFKNKSIPLDKVTSFDVNKAIQRSLTKAVARHGLGLYIYAGEDLPEESKEEKENKKKEITNHISLNIVDMHKLGINMQDESIRNWVMKCAKVKDLNYENMNENQLNAVNMAMLKLISEKKKKDLLEGESK